MTEKLIDLIRRSRTTAEEAMNPSIEFIVETQELAKEFNTICDKKEMLSSDEREKLESAYFRIRSRLKLAKIEGLVLLDPNA